MAKSGDRDFTLPDEVQDPKTNPFETSQVELVESAAVRENSEPTSVMIRCFGLWLLVCGISAIPSFLLATGMTQHMLRVPAMILGVLGWTVLYTFADLRLLRAHRRKNRRFHRAMVTGLGIRVLVSILLPVGFMVNMFPGAISVGVVSFVFYGADHPPTLQSFPAIFITTILQGLLLNVIVWLLVFVIFTLLLAFSRHPEVPIEAANQIE